jgi:copper(I)-binding protein
MVQGWIPTVAAEVHSAEAAKGHYAATLGNMGISRPWSRALPPTAHTGALFVSIDNQGEADHLVAAHADIADTVELHTHIHEDGLMKMVEVANIEVPAAGTLELKPGSYHIMLIGLRQPLVEGERFTARLEFARSGTVELEAEVLGMDAGTGASHLHHRH